MYAIALDPAVIEPWLEERRRLGLDRRDEVWEGVLHMVPPPSFEHDAALADFSGALGAVVKRHALGRIGNAALREPGSGERNYRVPDLIFVANGGVTRFAEGSDVWIEHGPDLVVEIRSPRDETMLKLPFYAARGVPEVLVVDRDSKRPEVYRRAGESYLAVAPDPDGGLAIECLRVRLFYRPAAAGSGAAVRLRDDRTGETVDVL